MPSKSKRQAKFMAAAANNPKFAKKVGIKRGVAREFHNADKRQKFAGGGLASMMQSMYARRPGGGVGMQSPSQGRLLNRDMRRPPPQGGLARASKPMPSRIMTPPGKRPMGRQITPPPGKSVGLQMPPGSVSRGRMPPVRGMRGNRPRMGGLARYAGAGGSPGPARRAQQPRAGRSRFMGRTPGAQPGNGLLRTAGNPSQNYGNRLRSMMGRIQFAKGGSVAKVLKAVNRAVSKESMSTPPELSRFFNRAEKKGVDIDLIDDAAMALEDLLDTGLYEPYTPRRLEIIQEKAVAALTQVEEAMVKPKLARGGSVKKALAALEKARFNLQQGSDPDIDLIADALGKEVPEAKGLAQRIQRTFEEELEYRGEDPDAFRPAWQAVDEEFDSIIGELGGRVPPRQKIRTMLEDYTEGDIQDLDIQPDSSREGFFQARGKDLEGNQVSFEIDLLDPEQPVTFLGYSD